ncbi:Zinc Finger Protein 2 [Manis pentadactyla]|nr:Zinc Finger Protein 2 [Manis pentadactyla]
METQTRGDTAPPGGTAVATPATLVPSAPSQPHRDTDRPYNCVPLLQASAAPRRQADGHSRRYHRLTGRRTSLASLFASTHGGTDDQDGTASAQKASPLPPKREMYQVAAAKRRNAQRFKVKECPRRGVLEQQEAYCFPDLKRLRLPGSRTLCAGGLCPFLKGEQEGMASVSPTARYQESVTFEDVAVIFTDEEWKHLVPVQRDLYKEVMLENYKSIVALGLPVPRPDVIFHLKKGNEPWIADFHGSEEKECARSVSLDWETKSEIQIASEKEKSEGTLRERLGGKAALHPKLGVHALEDGLETEKESPATELGESFSQRTSIETQGEAQKRT